MAKISSIGVYCGSLSGNDDVFIQAGHKLGCSIAKANIRLVYGGGTKGLMGTLAQAVQAERGEILSIIPKFLIERETSIEKLKTQQNIIITETLQQRKQLMFENSDAFIAMPGGLGTLEELAETLTWRQLNLHKKPIILANINNFWSAFLALLNHMQKTNFIKDLQSFQPIVLSSIDEIMNFLRQS